VKLFELFGIINIDDKGAAKAIDGIGKKMDDFGKKMESAGKNMTKFVTLPLVGLATAAVKAAMDFEATQAKYETVFKGMTGASDKFIKEFQKLTPVTTAGARSIASGMQDLLVPLGFVREEATKMTSEFMHVTGALANFNSGTHSAEQVAAAMQSAITGEYQSLKALGIQLDATTIQHKAMEMGLITHKDQMNKQVAAQVLLAEVYAQSGDALAAYNEESLDTITKLKLAGAGAVDVAVKFGNHLLPMINTGIDKARDFVAWLDNLNEGQQKLVIGIGATVAAIGPLLLVTGKLITSFGVIAGTVGKITAAIGPLTSAMSGAGSATAGVSAAAGALGISIGALLGIIAGVVAAFVAIGVAIKQLWEENEEFRTNVTAIWEDISSSINSIVESIKGFFVNLNTFLGQFDADFSALWEAFKANVKEATEAIMSYIALFLNVLEGDWSGAWENIKDITGNITTIITNLIKFFGGLVLGLITSMVASVIAKITDWAAQMGAKVRQMANDVVSAVVGLVGQIKQKISDFTSAGLDLAKAMIQGIVNGIRNGVSLVVSAAKDMARKAFESAKSTLGINSPSKVFMDIGENVSEGMAKGIDSKALEAATASKNMAGGLVGATAKAFTETNTYNNSIATPITINTLNVRNDSDIKQIAKELFALQQRAMRGGGLA